MCNKYIESIQKTGTLYFVKGVGDHTEGGVVPACHGGDDGPEVDDEVG